MQDRGHAEERRARGELPFSFGALREGHGWSQEEEDGRARALSRRARAAISISRKPKNSLGREGGREGVGKMPKMTVGVEKVSRAALLLPFLRGGGSTFTRSRERDKAAAAADSFPFRYISNKIFRGEGAKFGSFSQTDVVALGSGGGN